MKYTIYDIETTGFNCEPNTVLSLAYLTFNRELTGVLDSGVMYYYKEGQAKSTPKALEVHQLTEAFLKEYEDDYAYNMQKAFKILTRGNLVTWNGDTFDNRFMSRVLAREGYGSLEYNRSIDVMKVWRPVFGKVPKLTKWLEYSKIPEEIVELQLNKWFKDAEGFSARSHDAAYDVTVTAMALLEAKRRGLIDGL